ncbi:MAG: hypothetical protein A2087_10395 [Spirochaetes bacterium GWD1_61_31]|nr:MAG: hypothetical protein A2Y37_12120 [Spirochaetes bacterium GWB1_60_80]OHD30124.1 MAG: hypothetical protein A2004_13980 [Spirochaetes bacterium GWC1_61_12]OHD34623.1 MAG: hypothetical protein A2087_10395 [Spirochaetes bacterium GWD1_61_31]OHD46439.1 MAG: hypothetical protein A2Y35_10300 [Spirochaetes bacterium GWE1_60_18]OHD59494.1 MAG: hypothetical protein A2Y32_10255 [Spirochaetes bacterium GWF1_60_12]HAW85810.1 hypothetical protein [Spirochaetaceae bacterium]
MKVIDLTNLRRKDAPVLYRKVYYADAIVEVMADSLSLPIEFVVEHKPLGGVEIRVTLIDDIDYPILPIINHLKLHISELQSNGALP